MKDIIYLVIVVIITFTLSNKIVLNQNLNNCNLYILHTKKGNIRANYHNSRDLNQGRMYYYQGAKEKSLNIKDLDSVTVLSENIWTCGPRGNFIKYHHNYNLSKSKK